MELVRSVRLRRLLVDACIYAEAAAQRIGGPVGPGMDNGYLVSKGEARAPRDSVRNMSQQNVAVARRWVELFNGRDDVDEFLSLHDPEVVLHSRRASAARARPSARLV